MTSATVSYDPGAEVARLLDTPAGAALARRLGRDVVLADLRACLDRVTGIVHAHPTVIPAELTGVFRGGKRLRPLLVLAAAYASGPPSNRPYDPGVGAGIASASPSGRPHELGVGAGIASASPSGRPHEPGVAGYSAVPPSTRAGEGDAAAGIGAGQPSAQVRERAVAGAAAVELLHAASLVHDDIMDGARLRHGVKTLNARLGTDRALVAGDLLLGHAHVMAAGVGGDAAGLVGRTLVRLCEGQAEEYLQRYDTGRTEPSYFRSVEGKTGSLFEACCRMGALAAGHDTAATAALGRFGLHLGVAFQLADDLLDLAASPSAVGKPVGCDIAGGVYTYPTLWALQRDPRLREALSKVDDADAVEEATQRIRASGALGATRAAIADARGRCLAALGDARPVLGLDGVDLLADLAHAVVPA